MIPPLLLAAINWHSFFFLLFALVACGMALAVVFSSNIVRMAFFLTISLGAVSGLFILAGAHFVGAMQLMIYVGGTLVLLIFGVMLTSQAQFIEMKTKGGEWILAAVVGGSLLSVLLAAAMSVSAWHGPDEALQEKLAAGEVQVAQDTTAIGDALMGWRPDSLAQANTTLRHGMSGYLFHFEIVSMHLLVVLIGAAFLARARVQTAARPRPRPAPAATRRRGKFVTAVLLLAIAAHAFCGAVALIPGAGIKEYLPGFASAESWLMPALGICCLLDALLLMVILNWQSWGYWALFALALVEVALIYGADAGGIAVAGTLAAAVVWLAILGGLLCIGGNRSMWSQME